MTQHFVTDDGKISLTVAAYLNIDGSVDGRISAHFVLSRFCFSFYDPFSLPTLVENADIHGRRYPRYEKSQFTVHYQPVFNVQPRSFGGVEH